MIEVNKYILDTLTQAKDKLSNEAASQIREFLLSQFHPEGGCMDRAGNQDPYYSVFAYTLALIFDLEIPLKKQSSFLEKWAMDHEIDFIHAISIIQCKILISILKLKSHGNGFKQLSRSEFISGIARKKISKKIIHESDDLLKLIESYRSKDYGYNQNQKNADSATSYATFLAWTLFQDLDLLEDHPGILKHIKHLRKEDGSFVNELRSVSGVTTATAAGLIMSQAVNEINPDKSMAWIEDRWIKQGGFVAAEGLPIADLLSTSTALLALKIAGDSMANYSEACAGFVNMHWDRSGGFFGSVADMKADCEYTYYALLALGLI